MGIAKTKTMITYDPESGHLVGVPVITVDDLVNYHPDKKLRGMNKVLKEVERFGRDMRIADFDVRMLEKTFADYYRGMAEDNTITVVAVYGDYHENSFMPKMRIGSSSICLDDMRDENLFAGLLTLGQVSTVDTIIAILGVICGTPSAYGFYISADGEASTIPTDALNENFFEMIGMPSLNGFQPNRWDFSFSFDRNVSEFLGQWPMDDEKAKELLNTVQKGIDSGLSIQDACRKAEETIGRNV